MNRDLKELEGKIGYTFQNKELMENAMRHSSYANETRKKLKDNERLEFLGDAVLELSSSEFIFENYPAMPEGDMTKLRASIVCEPTLAQCAAVIELGSFLRLGKGEELTGGRFRDSIVSDAMEALIGAIYLDGGFASAKEFILNYVLNDLDNKKLFFDSKTILQEMLQAHSTVPEYRIIGESGPEHCKTFEAEVFDGVRILGCGKGHNKKSAEQKAAYNAIVSLKNRQGI